MNLAAPIPGYDLTLERSETAEEHRSRLAQESGRALITDGMWVVLFLFLIAVAGGALWLALFKDNVAPADREFAQKLVIPLISGTVAFVFGRMSAK